MVIVSKVRRRQRAARQFAVRLVAPSRLDALVRATLARGPFE